jgi:hypothetical protein
MKLPDKSAQQIFDWLERNSGWIALVEIVGSVCFLIWMVVLVFKLLEYFGVK